MIPGICLMMEIRLNIYFNVALLEKFGLDPLDIHTNTHTHTETCQNTLF